MKTRFWILLVAVSVLLAGCALTPRQDEPRAEPTEIVAALPSPSPSPKAVRTGVTLLADGTLQTVLPPVPLAFETGGKLEALYVLPGDVVQAGDLVATLDDTSLQDQVAEAELNLRSAKLALEDLSREASADAVAAAVASLATAQSSLTTLTLPPREPQLEAAQQRLISAQQTLQDLLDQPDPNAVESSRASLKLAEMQVQAAQAAYDQIAWTEHVAMTEQAQNLWQATTQYEQAQADFRRAQQGASAGEIANARAQIASAQAELDSLRKGPTADEVAAAEAQVAQAQAALDALLDGPSEKDLATAEINVAQAQLTLEKARRALEAVELFAPAPGTVISVDAAPGTFVAAGSPIATLDDVAQLEFHTTNLSERDLAQIVPGQAAVVTLKTYPDDAIDAHVVRIGLQAGEPVGDAATFPVILVLGDTDLDLRPGMTGRVEIRSQE